MTKEQLSAEVWALIDQHAMEQAKPDYAEFLRELRNEAGIRLEAVEEELDDEFNDDDET